ncbi:sensor histidine kinase [Pseudonocardia sp. GCM10023141]|uniref:sensor histidine kinase n=1 Tax=Pseudonocardia sp. GCM10023141 TaxID=3252653 RepID=UPI00361270BE
MAGRGAGWSDGTGAPFAPDVVSWLVRVVLGVIFVAFAIDAVGYVVAADPPGILVAGAVACLIAMLAVQLHLADPRTEPWSRPARVAVAVQLGLVFLPMTVVGEAWTGLIGFAAGGVLLVLPPAFGWSGFAAVTAAAWVAQALVSGPVLESVYIAANTVLIGLVVFGLSRLRSLVVALHATRAELADAAITRQRLLFAAEVRDLLGRRLSAITLKAELAGRLVPVAPDAARREQSEIITIARDALTDVRTIASGYREISLDEELASVRSALAAAGVTTVVRRATGELPPRIASALATAVREGVTNVLRHSAARHCRIELAAVGGSVTLEISNDGVTAAPAGDQHGDGLDNLTRRVEALGGSVYAGPSADGYALRVELPRPVSPAAPVVAAPRRAAAVPAPATATAIVAGFGAAYLVLRAVLVVDVFGSGTRPDIAGAVVAIGCAAACVLLQLVVIAAPAAPRARAVLLVQLVLGVAPVLLFHDATLGALGLVAGTALLVLRIRPGLIAFGALAVGSGVLGGLFLGTWLGIAYPVLSTVNGGLEWATLLRLHGLVRSLHAARTERASLAVTQERLRFARDLHDLLGYSVSAIALKAELSQRLVDRDAGRARSELAEIATVSRQALADIRVITRASRVLLLDDEVASARTLLTAAGVTVTSHIDGTGLPADVRGVLATVLREGVTNLLRHSRAEQCAIVVTRTGATVVLEIVNDGAVGSTGGGGAGIPNLTDRVAEVGGVLSVEPEAGGGFRLRAEVPIRELPDGSGEGA